MNFPENAATDCDNVEFTIVGDTLRRLGMNRETNGTLLNHNAAGLATNTYKWDNVGGDGSTQFVVSQIGGTLYFYNVSTSTTASPISSNELVSTVTVSTYTASGGSFRNTVPCEFSDGNGYLFVYHPDCDPFYCTYASGAVSSAIINIQIRDFAGIPETGIADNFRPPSLTTSHQYNLFNQGWSEQPGWSATSTSTVSYLVGSFNYTWTIQTGLTISASDAVTIVGTNTSIPYLPANTAGGSVVSYNSVTGALIVSVPLVTVPFTGNSWTFTHPGTSYVSTFLSAASLYPSNAEQWWSYKNTSNVYQPSVTLNNIPLGSASAPKGHYLLSAFDQNRSGVSGISGLTRITTTARPTNGCWFQGRVWYTGVNSSFAASGTAPFTTWTESIYFSQIVNKTDDFGKCYQANDPTSEGLFDLLPTDGGVIVIQGSGAIYRLFPIQNGMLVFAANGVWFITGSQGIGFSANDYTITKISNIPSISSTSFVNVMGLPYFWNEEGIYQVSPAQQGGLEVNAITVGTILSFYESIPLESKKFVRASYHPIDYVIQWVYRNSNSTSTTEKFTYDRILNYNVYNKAFYPYTIDATAGAVKSIVYIFGPGGTSSVEPGFKYLCSIGTQVSFADLHDDTYVDWGTTDYSSYFVTGYKLHGQAQRRFQVPYVHVYNRQINDYSSYRIQFQWDYATSGSTGRWSTSQFVETDASNYSVVMRRHRVRGHGLVLQMKISSVSGEPFDVIGWSMYETQNTGV